MLKVMRIFSFELGVDVELSHAERCYQNFDLLKMGVRDLIITAFAGYEVDMEIKQFYIHPFNPVRYISHDGLEIAEQNECQIEAMILLSGEFGTAQEKFRFDVATSEQADIDAAQKYMRPTSWGHQVNFSKVIRIPKGHRIPSFISSTNSVDKS